MSALKAAIDRANPNTISDSFRVLQLGKTLASDVKQTKRNVDMDALGTDPSELGTLDAIVLPEDARAGTILRAYSRAGSAGQGELVVDPPNTTPGTGDIAVSPAGNIVALAADAHTDVDVEYIPVRGDVVEISGVPAVGVLAIPTSLVTRGVLVLLEAEALVATIAGRKIVVAPAAGLPATLQARLDVAKANVSFNNATDVVTSARARLLVVATVDSNAELEADSALL